MAEGEAFVERGPILIKDPASLSARLGRETLLVTGSPRGATSLIAYVLLRGGYPLAATQRQNHEDREIVAARHDRRRLSAIIAERNATASRWGFKLPFAAREVAWYADNLRDPVFVMIYRNPLAIARSILHRHPGWPQSNEGIDKAMRRGLEMMTAGTDVLGVDAPAILIDVDASKTEPEALVCGLYAALSLDVPADRVAEIAAEVQVSGYRKITTT